MNSTAPASILDKRRHVVWTHDATPGLELHLDKQSASRCRDRHTHDTYSVGLIRSGHGTMWLRGQQHAIGQGDLLLIEPGHLHACQAGDQLGYAMFYLDTAWFERTELGLGDGVRRFGQPIHQRAPLHRQWEQLALLLASPETAEAKLESLLLASGELFGLASDSDSRPNALPAVAITLRDYLLDNWELPVSLTELAALAQMSPYQVLRLFNACFGMPPHRYQLQYRIRRAQLQIARSDITLTDLALNCGFADQSHFSRHFQRIVGVSPGIYRNALRAG